MNDRCLLLFWRRQFNNKPIYYKFLYNLKSNLTFICLFKTNSNIKFKLWKDRYTNIITSLRFSYIRAFYLFAIGISKNVKQLRNGFHFYLRTLRKLMIHILTVYLCNKSLIPNDYNRVLMLPDQTLSKLVRYV